jgi:hypothetical protein
MSISGSLEDVAVADVLQFIHLGKRTGTLELEREGQRARFGFHEGALISAQAPGAPRLGELLLRTGRVSAGALERAMAAQSGGGPRRSLGQILIEAGDLRPETLHEVVKSQLEGAVGKVMSWESGSFDFALDETRPVDDIGMDAGELAPGEGLATNVVLLEAARIFDERDRRGGSETLEEVADEALDGLLETEPEPDLGAGLGPEIRALSPDREFVRRLRERLGPVATLRRVALGRVAEPPSSEVSDLVLVDARAGALDPEGLSLLRTGRPEARIVVLVDSDEVLQLAYRHGAVAAVPADVETVCACLVNLLEAPAGHAAGPRPGGPALTESGVRRLQRVFGELRSGLASATVALNLMQLVSESFERAVLFLVKRDRLATLGAFGSAADGRPLAIAVRRVEAEPCGLLERALVTSQVQIAPFAEADLPGALAASLGAPVNDQIVVFPVSGTEKVIAIVYADNGDSERAPRDVDLLEVAAAQVGIAFENELLRRQLGRGPV